MVFDECLAYPASHEEAARSMERSVRWADVLRQGAEWYIGDQARDIADSVLLYQRASGGWPKDIDMTARPVSADPAARDATIDNGATTTPIRLLARVRDRQGRIESRYRERVEPRGPLTA